MTATCRYFIQNRRLTVNVSIIPFVLGLLSTHGLSAQKPPLTHAVILPSTVAEVPRSITSFDVEPMTFSDRFSYYERHTYDSVSSHQSSRLPSSCPYRPTAIRENGGTETEL
jgi:hypothetical protein